MLLENVFSWSKSRDEEFRECRRKYYYDRYAAWGGWDKTAPPTTRQAYGLKNLKNRWAWKGETVHHAIEHSLKSLRARRPVPSGEALARLTDAMRRDYKLSKSKKYIDEPKRVVGLFEHEYEKPVSDDTWKALHDSSAECLKNFYESELFGELSREDPASWLVIEDLEEFDFEGAKIFVKLDFARKKGGIVEIYDWKTGKDGGDGASPGIQIGTYAIYAMRKWSIPLNGVRAFLFNLTRAPAAAQEQLLTERLIKDTKSAIQKSIEGMRLLLADGQKNIPKPKEDFPFTENVRLCESCNFLKICDKYASP